MESTTYCKAFHNNLNSISKISGEILAHEGTNSTQTMTDVVCSIWTDYNEFGDSVLKGEQLNYLIIENEDSYLMVTHLFGYILALKASHKVSLGLLKVHMDSIAKFLNEKLYDYKEILKERAEN